MANSGLIAGYVFDKNGGTRSGADVLYCDAYK